jgi:hypothetical protein
MRQRATGIAGRIFCLALSFIGTAASAQVLGPALKGVDVQKLANGVIGIMSYTVAPDVTTSSLAIDSAATASPGITMTQFGGGFTWSKSTPLYLEGNAAYSRYDPVFLASDGADARPVPAKWNSFSGTGGIGWDFPIAENWVVRPIFNFTLGYVASDLAGAKWWLDNNTNLDLSFVDGGTLKAYGLGGSLMFDYEKFAPDADDDIELRYTNVNLHSYGGSTSGVTGHARSESASVWARRRVPTGWVVWDRPVRYVFEFAFTRYLGNETDLGLKQMSSIGFGLELDSSAFDRWATRWRIVGRYKFGPDAKGTSIGLAISF